jgi:hypothetical protein
MSRISQHFPGLLRPTRHSMTNEPKESTIEPGKSTNEPRDSTNEPNRRPMNPARRNILFFLGKTDTSRLLGLGSITQKDNFAERTCGGLARAAAL